MNETRYCPKIGCHQPYHPGQTCHGHSYTSGLLTRPSIAAEEREEARERRAEEREEEREERRERREEREEEEEEREEEEEEREERGGFLSFFGGSDDED
jgi:hypothetical protein